MRISASPQLWAPGASVAARGGAHGGVTNATKSSIRYDVVSYAVMCAWSNANAGALPPRVPPGRTIRERKKWRLRQPICETSATPKSGTEPIVAEFAGPSVT